LINQKDIQTTLKYTAFDLPSLESKIQRLTSDVIELEWKKKQSRDEVAILSSSIPQLKKSLNWYKMEIEQKKQIISNLNQHLNQKSNALEEKILTQQYN
jgi:CII-binding regulator of phage lambda lysogenization HflD